MVTIADVAKEANVANSTVSRALNGSAPASPEVRERVLQAAQRLGYRASGTARALRQSRTMTVGIVIPDLANPVFGNFLRGAEHTLQAADYSLFICDAQNSGELAQREFERLFAHRVDGILLGGPAPRAALLPFHEAGIPIEPNPFLPADGAQSRSDMEEAATLAAYRLLVRNGHRHIALVGRVGAGPGVGNAVHAARVERLRRLLESVASTDARCVEITVTGPGQLPSAVQTAAARPDAPTAYVAASHVLAAPLLAAIYGAGLEIPHDVSFLSFGDSEWAVAHRPPISVVRHDYYSEAQGHAIRLLAQLGAQVEATQIRPPLPSEFMNRGSIGPAPALSVEWRKAGAD
jgi:DNA-binding LacI/PurR family transcriptional regulator